eukprot:1195077-Prorocentrum_minimum.AAC.10
MGSSDISKYLANYLQTTTSCKLQQLEHITYPIVGCVPHHPKYQVIIGHPLSHSPLSAREIVE